VANSWVVQQAVQMNVTGGNRATAVFPVPLTAGNPILGILLAIDAGAALDGDTSPDGGWVAQYLDPADPGWIQFSDTQGNVFNVSARIWSDPSGYTVCGGFCTASPSFGSLLPGGADSVTFIFTPPISSPEKCLLALIAFELSDGGTPYTGGNSGGYQIEGTTTSPVGFSSPFYPEELSLYFAGGTDPAIPHGTLFLAGGIAVTNDGSVLTPGPSHRSDTPPFALASVIATTINGRKVTLGVQFVTSPHTTPTAYSETYYAYFGSTPGPGTILGSGDWGSYFSLYNAPLAQAAPPLFAPPPAAYPSTQSVTLTAAGADAIYYTMDGSTPTTGSLRYDGPLTVSVTTTIKAVAVKAGLHQSPYVGATYTLPERIGLETVVTGNVNTILGLAPTTNYYKSGTVRFTLVPPARFTGRCTSGGPNFPGGPPLADPLWVDAEVDAAGNFRVTLQGNDWILPTGTLYRVSYLVPNVSFVPKAYLISGNQLDLNVALPVSQG